METNKVAAEALSVSGRVQVLVGGRLVDTVVDAHGRASAGQVAAELGRLLDPDGLNGSAVLSIRGEIVPPGVPWADVIPPDGSVIELSLTPGPNSRRPPAGPGARFEVAVISGPEAGLRLPLPPGQVGIGRGSAVPARIPDPLLSRHHLSAWVDQDGVTIQDAGSSNRTRVDGAQLAGQLFLNDEAVLEAGRNLLAIRRIPPALATGARAPGSTRRVFRRPPRPRPAATEPVRLVLPPAPPEQRGYKLPWPTMLIPLVAAIGFVAYTRNPIYLMFALLSPLIALATWLSDGTSRRRSGRQLGHEYAAADAAFRAEVNAAARAEAVARRAAAPDLALLTAAAARPTTLLWQRLPGEDDYLQLRIGTATLASRIQLIDSHHQPVPPPFVSAVPVTVPLRDCEVFGVSGDASMRDPVTRGLVAQLATLHSPEDLSLALITTPQRLAAWDWMKWLPHLAQPNSAAPQAGTDEESWAAVADACISVPDQNPLRAQVVIIDAGADPGASPALSRLIARTQSGGIRVIALADSFHTLPRSCQATLVLDGSAPGPTGVGAVLNQPDGVVVSGIRWDGLDETAARELATALAGWELPKPVGTTTSSGGPPSSIGFLSSVGDPDLGSAAVAARWASPSGIVPRAICGAGADGPVSVDLRSGFGGPNSFMAGTVGSGKSDFLRSYLVSLALANGPDQLSMVLIDFKEGSGLEVLQRMPHVADILTNEHPERFARALTALTAEREMRQHRIKAAGYDSFDAFQSSPAASAGAPLPRLLIVVDEFAALRASIPDALSRLIDIVRRGRSAGMHLMLTTQTVSTSVGQDIIDNTSIKISLRVESESESRAVLGIPDAQRLPPSAQGRGYVSDGTTDQGRPRLFQAGWLGARTVARAHEAAVSVQRFGLMTSAVKSPPAAATTALPTDLERVLDALTAAAASIGVRRAASPWHPPLPERITLAELPVMGADRSGRLVLRAGLLDAPARHEQPTWAFDADEYGHLLIAGGSRSGRTTALRTLACSAALEPAGSVFTYVVEAAGRSLGRLAGLPSVGAVVTADDEERLARLLRMLLREIAARQSLLQTRGAGSLAELRRVDPTAPPRLLLLLDGFEALHDDGTRDESAAILRDLTVVLRDGPGTGVHAVITTDPSKSFTRVVAGLSARLALRMPDSSFYSDLGVSRDAVPVSEPPPGLAIWALTGDQVQIALLDPDPSGIAQNAAIDRLAASSDLRATPPFTAAPWPTEVSLADLAPALTGGFAMAPGRSELGDVLIGVGGDDLGPVTLPLGRLSPGILITGPRGGGRTAALLTVARQVSGRADLALVVVTPKPSALQSFAELTDGVIHLGGPDAVTGLAAALDGLAVPAIIIVDDAERILEPKDMTVLDTIIMRASERGDVILASMLTAEAVSQPKPWVSRLRRTRNALMLRPARSDISGLMLPLPPRVAEPAPSTGRGLLYLDGEPTRLHIASGH